MKKTLLLTAICNFLIATFNFSNAQPVKVGETWYDLQTNNSTPRSIVNYGDGTLSAIWTISPAGNPYTNRGTGYNYFNGTSWLPNVTTRLETFRTGFPSLGGNLLNGTGELTMAHVTSPAYTHSGGGNTAKGTAFTFFSTSGSSVPLTGSVSNSGPIWPEIAVGGSNNLTIHVVSAFADTTDIVNGVKMPVVYARSLDGGMTWDKVNVALPGYDSTRVLRGSAEIYAIDASGNNVAIVIGGLGQDVALWKSTDNGNNFTKMYVDSFPYAPDYGTNAPQDVDIPTNDGSVAVILDANGKAHVSYSTSMVVNSSLNGASFYPGSIGLVYWNEIDQTQINIPILDFDGDAALDTSLDLNGNGIYDIASNTTNIATGMARYGSGSILSKPSIARDANGNMFIVFSMTTDADSTSNGQSYRDVWAVKSCNGGTSWSPPFNLTKSTGFEEAFPAVAKLADNYLHILYQYDNEPGTALTNGDTDAKNDIYYFKVNTDSIPSSNMPPVITANGAITFCEGGNVVLSSNYTAGNAWSTLETTQSITVDTSGIYTVSVVAANGCIETSSQITVTVNPNPTATVTANGPTTFCTGGSVTLTSSAANSYSWSSGQTTQAITVTASGNYIVTVTDANGCTAVSSGTSVSVNNNPVTPTITANGATTFCQGGSVTLTSSSADSYLWSTGDTTQSITVSASGNYTVTTGSACGNATSTATTVTVNSNPTATISANGPTTFCNGGNVTLTSSSATLYNWSSGQTTQAITVNTSGNYTVTITDVNGCTSSSSATTVNVTSSPTAVITANGPTTFCQGESVTLSGNQGTAYQWSGGETTSSITVTQSGNYIVTITDAGGCAGTAVSSPFAVTVNSNPTPTITASGATTFCQGGSVTLTSSAANSYSWSSSETIQSITVSSSGSYSVTVTDANGCTGSSSAATVTVNPNPSTPTITASGATTFCQGGSVTLVSSSSSGNLWSNGEITPFINVNSSGNYSVTVTDGNGCSASSSATTVTVNPLPDATITANGATAFCEGGSVMLISGSSSGNIWTTGDTTQFLTVDSSANYILTVTDTNGCSASDTQNVTVNSLPVASITASDSVAFCQGGSVDLTATSASSYSWSNSETTQTITVNSSGNYSVTITDANGCTGNSSAITVTVNANPAAPTVTASGATTFCEGGNVTLTSSATSSNIWSTGDTTQSVSVDSSGSYSVTFTDGNGCTASSVATTVTVNPLPNATVTPGDTAFCQGGSITLTSSSITGNVWSNSQTTQSITVNSTGGYTVTVTQNGCSATSAPVNITVNPNPATPTITVAGNNLACSTSGMSGYVWKLMGVADTNCTTQFCVCSGNGFYSVVITDANGCTAESVQTDVSGCTTEIEENSLENDVSIFPNPNNGNFSVINRQSSVISQIKIYNVLGEIVYSKQLTTNNEQLTTNLSSGIYFIQISAEGETVNRKIVVE